MIPEDSASFVLLAIMIVPCVMWARLIVNARISSRHLPTLAIQEPGMPPPPLVSVIVPARNEEESIGLCIRSLVKQDYSNFEIILVDDGSEDATPHIMESFARKHENIRVLYTEKPDGWLGKTWACHKAAEEANGDLILFTDADTIHNRATLSTAVLHMDSKKLDCLTLAPRLKIPEMWVRATVPAITSFKLVYPEGIILFSYKKTNDPKNSMGGVNGAFFLVQRSTYDDVGGFESVKNEILEDWAIGRSIKRKGHTLQYADGSSLVDAMWARDLPTLNDIFKRLILPFARRDGARGWRTWLKLAGMLFAPYPATAASAVASFLNPGPISFAALAASGTAVALHMASYGIQERMLGVSLRNVLLAPLGGLVSTIGYLNGMKVKSTYWRGRDITSDEVRG